MFDISAQDASLIIKSIDIVENDSKQTEFRI